MFDKELLGRASAHVEELERKRAESKNEQERRYYEIRLKNARGVAWCAAAWDLVEVRREAANKPYHLADKPYQKEDNKA